MSKLLSTLFACVISLGLATPVFAADPPKKPKQVKIKIVRKCPPIHSADQAKARIAYAKAWLKVHKPVHKVHYTYKPAKKK